MAFDLSTAQPVQPSKFDLSTATPVYPAEKRPELPHTKYDPSEGGGKLNIAGYQTDISTPQWLDRTLAGAGESFANTGRGISQLFGGQSAKDTDEQRRLDAPLNHTTAGIAGNLIGGVSQMALPGAGGARLISTAGRAAPLLAAVAPELGGAVLGASEPVGTDESRLGNAGMGALFSTLGKGAGEIGKSVLRSGKDAVPVAARAAHNLAQRYGIDLTVPQLSDNSFLKHYSNLTDSLPFSGADSRARLQRASFNNAVGREAGIANANGAVTPDMLESARDTVGSTIGNLTGNYNALPTPQNVAGLQSVLNEARANATPEVQAIVEGKLKQIFAHVDPQTGMIPGDAWRQANTALGRQIRSTTDGDVKHYLGKIQGHFMDMMGNVMTPGDKDAWDEARGQYRNILSIAPLVEKGGNEGISPALLRQRLIAAQNNRGNLSDLADLGQEQIKQRVPNSGTAQKQMIAGMAGLGGAGAYEAMQNPMATAVTAGVYGANALANAALNSRIAAKYYMSRMPDQFSKYTDPALDMLAPGAAGASGPTKQDAQDALATAGRSGALEGHAEGGSVAEGAGLLGELVKKYAPEIEQKIAAHNADRTRLRPTDPYVQGWSYVRNDDGALGPLAPQPPRGMPADWQPPAGAAYPWEQDPTQAPAMADGGTVKKSTFWDLVAQAIKETTSPSNPPAQQPAPPPGSQATGSVGRDFNNSVDTQVSAQDH